MKDPAPHYASAPPATGRSGLTSKGDAAVMGKTIEISRVGDKKDKKIDARTDRIDCGAVISLG
jgi:hypothetical protein